MITHGRNLRKAKTHKSIGLAAIARERAIAGKSRFKKMIILETV